MVYKNINVIRIMLICSVILALGSMTAYAGTYTFSSSFGVKGSSNGELSSPTGIAMDSSGNIYIADTGNHRIQKFSKDGMYLDQFGSVGVASNEKGKFSFPQGIAVDTSGNIYVADSGNSRIQKLDSSGKYITQWGAEVIGDGTRWHPYGVAIDSANNVYVTDDTNARILKFSNDGIFLKQFGGAGNTEGKFWNIRGIFIDSSDNVYAVDRNNYRIEKFDSSGNYLSKFDTVTGSNLYDPAGVGVDSAGDVYVADTDHHRVVKFDSEGTYLTQWGAYGSNTGQFNAPVSIAVDSSNNIYVVEYGNSRIQVFAKSTITLADFSSSASSGAVPLEVKFKDASENAKSWSWDFGDGATSTEQNPTHTYSTGGKYTVKLTASNGGMNDIKLKTNYINAVGDASIEEIKPIETQTTPETIATTETKTITEPTATTIAPIASENTPVAGFIFKTNTISSDPLDVVFVDTSTKKPTSWAWNFGDGQISDVQNPHHKYAKPGIYSVELNVKNSNGHDTITKTVSTAVTDKIDTSNAITKPTPETSNPAIVVIKDESSSSSDTGLAGNPILLTIIGGIFTILAAIFGNHYRQKRQPPTQ